MRSPRWLLSIVLATAWGTGCGGTSGPQRDSGGSPDTAKGSDTPVLALDAPWLPPAAPPDTSPAGEADAELPPDLQPDAKALGFDTAGSDAPATEIDAPLLPADTGADEAEGQDIRDGGQRDADSRDDASDEGRRDSSPDDRADVSGDPSANLVVPEVNGTIYSFRFGDTVFAVDAAKGARIVTFSLGGRNVLLAAKNAGDINWGSTFWTSPQSDWSWPPPTEIDSGTYTASLSGATLTLTGATANALGLSVSKKFTVDRGTGVVNIDYRISNRATRSRSVAPWEISRVAAGGLTFFPMGEGTPSKGSQPLLPLEVSGGVAWLAYDANLVSGEAKVFADGSEGWIAHASSDLLFVKAFGDIAPTQAASSETEIELYADPSHSYIEVEDQGALAALAAGASRSWTVRWFLRPIDPAIAVETGSAELLGMVRALVQNP